MRCLTHLPWSFVIFLSGLDNLDACMDDFVASSWENLASGFVMMEQDNKMLSV